MSQTGTNAAAPLPQSRINLFKTADQDAAALNDDISWATAVGRDLVLVTPSVALRANKTYRLQAALRVDAFSDVAQGAITYEWVDAANAVIAATTRVQGILAIVVATTTVNIVGSELAMAIVTPAAAITAKLRITAATGTVDISSSGSWALIEEVL